ncbi:MAG: phosphatidylinositol 4-kinase [Candidatus Brocadiaceae bacterium]|nr:phosphatidylinositol 4-kinase [Candidatus Brocadiaceae bacterium]
MAYDMNSHEHDGNIPDDELKKEIFGSIRDKEIENVECERLMGAPRGPEKITFKDGSIGIFKCDIRHYWMADNPDTAIREALVYQIDKTVGLGLVPRTMVIDDTIGGIRYNGSIQEWIKDARDGYQMETITPEQKKDYERLMVFDFVIGNSDRHLENILFSVDNKVHAIDNNACLIIDKDEDILAFPDQIIRFFSKKVVPDIPHIVELIETFHKNKNKIVRLIDNYIHDNTKLARLMVESRINYLFTMLKKNKPFPRKYLEWRKGLDAEIQRILS